MVGPRRQVILAGLCQVVGSGFVDFHRNIRGESRLGACGLGGALLGCRVGDTVSWTTPDGREHRAEIVALHFQPEASGDYAT